MNDMQYILIIILLLIFAITMLLEPKKPSTYIYRKQHKEDMEEVERLMKENARLREVIENGDEVEE